MRYGHAPETVAEAREELGRYVAAAAVERRRAGTAATTAAQVADMYDSTADAAMVENYLSRLDEARVDVERARRRAETTRALAESRVRSARRAVEIGDVRDEQPHPYRPRTYGDILAEMEEDLDAIRTRIAGISGSLAVVEEARDRVPR